MLWKLIEELTEQEKYRTDLLLCAPELVDLDCNVLGVAPGYWQDGPLTLGGDEEGEWVAAGYCMQHDHFVNRTCNPTHFLFLQGPDHV